MMTLGWIPGEAEGAIALGTRIEKVNSEATDTHRDGETGVVVSSHEMDPESRAALTAKLGELADQFVYFVIWDDGPKVPAFVRGKKIRPGVRQ